jgi:uncharacterized membrane protein YphA (DoxX/SURF4 family)
MAAFAVLFESRLLALFSRAVLGLLFLASGVGKLLEPREEFIALVQSYAVIPDGLAVVYATMLPWVELIVAVLLIVGLYTRWAAVIGNLMLFSFIMAVSIVLIRDGNLDNCGCFGAFAIQEAPEAVLARDAMFFLLGVILLYGRVQPFSLDKKLS